MQDIQDTPPPGASPTDPVSDQPAPPRFQRERTLRVRPEKLQKTFQEALSRTVRLIPVDLPSGCSAAWFGDTDSDWICYPTTDRTAIAAMTHVVGHLSLLHCGRARDGGRFVCVDESAVPWHLLHRFFMLIGQDSHDWPSPLFTQDQERAAEEAAAALRDQCGFWPEASIPSQAAREPGFRCLG